MAINTLYLDNGVIKSARNIYNTQNPKNIRLENFFQNSIFSLLQKKVHNSKYLLKFVFVTFYEKNFAACSEQLHVIIKKSDVS